MRRWLAPALLAAACGGGEAPTAPAAAPAPTAPLVARAPDPAAGPSSEIVATVDGRPITVGDVARQARAAGQDAHAALDALVEAEVLAGEAARRGLVASPEVTEARDAALARRLLRESFEREITPQAIPDEELQRLYARNRTHFDHPDARQVWHILVRSQKSDDAARRALVRRKAAQVHAAAAKVKSVDEFKQLATALSDDDFRLRAEEIDTIPGRYVKEFVDAVFAIPRPGMVSPVVETEFGDHVIYYVAPIPAVHVSFEEAKPPLRDGDWPDFQRRAFARWVDELVEKHHAEIFPGKLDEKATP